MTLVGVTGSEGSHTVREVLIADNAAFTPGTDAVLMAGFEFDDTTPNTLDEGDSGAARMSSRRELYIQIRDAAGNERGLNVDSSGNITVNVTGTVTVDASGTAVPITDNSGSITVDWNGTAPPIGAGTEAAALRVTLATDSTGVVSIDDNGGAITVDNGGTFAVQAAQSGTWNVTNVSGTVSLPTGASTAAKQPTLYTEDAAAAANPDGNAVILVRADTPAGIASADGDNVAQRGTDYGAAYVQVVDSSGSFVDTFGGGTQYTEDAAAAANPTGNAIILVRADTPAGIASADGDNLAQRGTNYGAAYVTLVNSSGSVLDAVPITDNSGAITVDWAGTAPPIGAGTEAAALRVTVATDSTGVLSVDDNGGSLTVDVGTALPAGTNAIGKLAANSGVDIGDVDVTSISAGSNLIGDVGIGVRTSGGATYFKDLDVDETEDAIKATAGQLYWLYCFNTTNAILYVKLYNATTANVTVGTTTPVLTLPVPGNNDTDGAGVTFSLPMGLAFSTAITIACTTGVADADTGAPAANAMIVAGAYN